MQLQRSSVSFRRQGSSGRVWEDIQVDRSGPLLTSFSGPITPTTARRRSQDTQPLDNIRSGREQKFQTPPPGNGNSGGDELSTTSSLPAEQKLQRRNGGGAFFFIRCCSGSPPTS
ncbi:hypothetical protein LINPERPRIM_LOCUS14548 [Linum perenne]